MKKGWECDIFKIDKDMDVKNPPFNYRDYDFLCVGSGVYAALPAQEMIDILHKSPLSAHMRRGGHKRVVPGPQKGIVFATYAGAHLGPKEAVPALGILELEMEHLKFEYIGSFACPGKFVKTPTPGWWHGDIRDRPNERDLQKAEIWMEEKIEELHYS